MDNKNQNIILGIKLTPDQNELYKRVDEVLHYLCDSIGVSDAPEARDKYWSYFPVVFGKPIYNSTKNEIAEYLTNIKSETMRLSAKKKHAA